MTSQEMRRDWLYIAACVYLGLPFIIFALTWLKPLVGIPLVIIVIGLWLRGVKGLLSTAAGWKLDHKSLLVGIVILGVWVVLSGIGGYMFQNRDHYLRNAIFRDLIQYDWPVLYWKGLAGTVDPSHIYMQVYYNGYWLPAAIVGKWLGWDVARFVLFLWSWAGVVLVVSLICRHLRTSFLKSALLLILFSGMDALGVIIVRLRMPQYTPTLWPPIQFIEGWSSLHYSSFTTQLFWVFNQAVPTWLLAILLISHAPRRQILLLWSFTFFCAPLPGLGLALLILGEALFTREKAESKYEKEIGKLTRLIAVIRERLTPYFSLENVLAGGSVFLVTFSYFASNVSAEHQQVVFPKIEVLLVFFAVEAGILGLLIFRAYRRDWRWYAVMALLFFIPLGQIGYGSDFRMRVSIPPLFYLMMLAGDLAVRKGYAFRIPILISLAVGAFTPVYEINRSLYRTFEYVTGRVQPQAVVIQPDDPSFFDYLTDEPIETAHPNTLTADAVPTLALMRPDQSSNFVGKVEHSFFYEFLANK